MRRTEYVLLALAILSVTTTAVPTVASVPAAGAPTARHLNLADTYRGIPFRNADDVTLSADGRFLYASHFLSGLSVLGRSAADESFEMLASYFKRDSELSGGIEYFTLSPDEAHLYVLGSDADAVEVLARDPLTGLLRRVQTLVTGEGRQPADLRRRRS